ncbi:MAG: leucine-rich repeat domain-containing protein [Propionibacteriaceae bacterium]|nr:leucine-rich repeat domain-containing protein [Propionibacteriaceae bacterium]
MAAAGALLGLVAAIGGLAPARADDSDVVPDASFRACLNVALRQPAANALSAAQLGTLSGALECDGAERSTVIDSIEGAQYLTGVTSLDLAHNRINDLSPLAGLTGLTTLDVLGNAVTSLTPLADLAQLTVLDVRANQVADLTGVNGLTGLVELYADGNQIADLSPLVRLTGLQKLWLGHNQIADLSYLSGLTQLRELSLEWNQVADVTPLAGAGQLQVAYLQHNAIADLSPLPAGLAPESCDANNVCTTRVFAANQVAAATATTGTQALPIAQLRGSQRSLVVTSGGAAVDQAAATVTYTNPGQVTLDWTTAGNAYFSGTLTVTVTGEAIGASPTPEPSATPTPEPSAAASPAPEPSAGPATGGATGTGTSGAGTSGASTTGPGALPTAVSTEPADTLPGTGTHASLNELLFALWLVVMGLSMLAARLQLLLPESSTAVPQRVRRPGRHRR